MQKPSARSCRSAAASTGPARWSTMPGGTATGPRPGRREVTPRTPVSGVKVHLRRFSLESTMTRKRREWALSPFNPGSRTRRNEGVELLPQADQHLVVAKGAEGDVLLLQVDGARPAP